ncbi:MAG: non-canonical purine NTP pyrophosphatase [Dehalococcoidia bacterium]
MTTRSSRRFVLASGNAGKVREFRAMLEGSAWQLLTPAEAGATDVSVIETGRSYLENATLKAVAHAAATGLPALADDSGIEVDALDGRPGVLSARFGGPSVTSDAARSALLLRRLEGVPPARRGARFRAVLVLALPGDRTFVREGTLEGRIATAPRGANGFGYDPVFELPDGRTAAELGPEKDRISHRARAMRAMMDVLNELAASD